MRRVYGAEGVRVPRPLNLAPALHPLTPYPTPYTLPPPPPLPRSRPPTLLHGVHVSQRGARALDSVQSLLQCMWLLVKPMLQPT